MLRRRVASRHVLALVGFALLLALSPSSVPAQDEPATPKSPEWRMKATIIEACSCPMFCQCYFDSKPAAHGGGHAGHGDHGGGGGDHFCRFNNAFRVDDGRYGDVRLDGAKFWVAGDLGGDFSQGKMDWAALFFDPAVTPEQREGIKAILAHVYPVQWGSFTVMPDAKIDWRHDKAAGRAEAKADGGRVAEVVLNRAAQSNDADKPIVMQNLKYWGTPRNEGFVMMPNEVEALRVAPEGKQPYEFKGTNGFMITFDINDKDVAAASKQAEARR